MKASSVLTTRRFSSPFHFAYNRTQREAIAGYLFVGPVVLGFLIWVFIPMVATMGISLTNWPIIGNAEWVGLSNYTSLFDNDPFFFPAVKATTIFAFGSIILRVVYTFLVALLLNQ